MSYKAVIPMPGISTRLIPVTSVFPKALFSVVDGAKGVRTVLHVFYSFLVIPGTTQEQEKHSKSRMGKPSTLTTPRGRGFMGSNKRQHTCVAEVLWR